MFRLNSLLIISILLLCMMATSATAGGSKRRNIGSSSKRRRAESKLEPKNETGDSKKGKKPKPKPKPKSKSPKTNSPTPVMVQSGPSGTPKTSGAQKSCNSDNDCGNQDDYYCLTEKSICCKRNEVCGIEGAPASGGSGFTQLPVTSVIVVGLITAIALNF
jgi:hypothetical protein